MQHFFGRLLTDIRGSGEKWEALCHGCGMCCHDRYLSRKGELMVDLSSPCEFFDSESKRCRVYTERFRSCPDCRRLTVFHAIFSRYLPGSCGYVRAFRFWRRRERSMHR